MCLDSKKLSLDQLEPLLEILPAPDEVNAVTSYKGDVTKLGRAETWFLAAAKIPRLTARLNNCLFTLQFRQSVKDLKASAGTIRKVSRLRTLLQLTLVPTTQQNIYCHTLSTPRTQRIPS